MRDPRADRPSGHGRRSLLGLLAVVLAVGATAGLLSGSAAADGSCPGSDDVYTPAIGTSGDWSAAGSWSEGIPTGTEVACWESGVTVTVSDTESVDSIQALGDLDIISGGTLELTSTTDNSSLDDLFLEGGGELDGPDTSTPPTLTVAADFDWGGSGSGDATLDDPTIVTGSDLAIESGPLTIDGATSTPVFDAGSIDTGGSAVSITNASFETSGTPTLTTTSTITFGSGVNVTGSGSTFTAAGVEATGGSPQTYGVGGDSLVLTGGTTTVASGETLASGPLALEGGTLEDDGIVDPSPSAVTVSGGTLDGTGSVEGAVANTSGGTVSPGDGAPGVLTVDGNYSQVAGATLAVELEGTTAGSGGFGQLAVGGTATLGGDLSLTDSAFTPASGESFEVVTSTGSESGTFTLDGPDESAYAAEYDPNDVTLVVVPAGCTASNPDVYTATTGDWSTDGNWSQGAPPTSGGVACWAAGTTVTVSTPAETADSIEAGGDLDITTGGTLTLASSSDSSTLADLSLDGGAALDGPGTGSQAVGVSGSFDWGGADSGDAALSASGSLAITAGTVTMNGTTSTPAFDGGSIMSGAVSIGGSNFAASGSPTLTTTSTITLGAGVDLGGSGATFVAAGVNATGVSAQLYGFGSNGLTLTGGTTTVASASTLTSGPLTVTGGTLQDDGTVDPSSTTLAGGTLDGAGTVDGGVANNAGTVSPGDAGPGVLTVTGSYSQSVGGTLAIVVSGATSGEFSELAVEGTATIAGDLALSGSYSPAPTDTFEILASTGLTGEFTDLSGSGASTYFAQYSADDVTLAVPSSNCPSSGSDLYTATSGNWSTATNWSQGAPPTGTQVACWAANTTVTVSSAESVNSIQAGGNLIIGGGTLTLGSASAATTSTVGGLSLDGGGGLGSPSSSGHAQALHVDGSFDWGGAGSGTAALNHASGSSLEVIQPSGDTLTIDGTSSTPALDGGSVLTGSPVTITNTKFTGASGTSLTTSQAITLGTAGAGVDLSTGSGTIVAGGIDTLDSGGTNSVVGFGLHLTTGASSSLASGVLNVKSLTTDASTTLPVPSGASLNVSSGAVSGVVNGAGTFTQESGGTTTIEGNGALSTDTVDVPAGTLTVDSGASYSPATTTTVSGGVLNLDASGSTGALSVQGGQVNGTAGDTLTVSGGVTWSAGVLDDLALDQTGTGFTVSGASATSLDGGSVTTNSPVSITSTDFATSGAPTVNTSSTITLGPAVSITGSGATFFAAGLGPASGTGAGEVTTAYDFGDEGLMLTGGTTMVEDSGTLETGPLTLAAGTLQDYGTIVATGTTLTGGTLEGTGTVDGTVTNSSGTVASGATAPGLLTVEGNYAQGGGGTLAIELDGTTAGSGFSQLRVSGSATLAGSLSLTDIDGFVPASSDTFEVLSSGSARTGAVTLTGPSAAVYVANYDPNDVTLSVSPTPANTVAPAISGTPSVGQTLTCSDGTWSSSPRTYTFQWNRDGSPIAGATSSTYPVSEADAGHSLTCTVTASNGFGPGPPATSAAVSVPAPAGAPPAPVNLGAPVVSGTPTPGNALTCSEGVWLESPTAFTYVWARNGLPIAGATGSTYVVQIADEGSTLTCAVIATNAGGGAVRASTGTVVAEPGTLTCVKPTGRLSGRSLGPLELGFKRSRARHAVRRYTASGGTEDDFCLYGGWGIHAGYPSAKLLGTVSRGERGQLKGRIVLALTSNPYYALNGARPGMALAAVAKRLHVGKAIRIGANYWYLAPGSTSRGVLRVRGGIIQEVGIATKAFTTTSAAQRRFLSAFNSA